LTETYLISVLGAFFAILNPIGNMPLFLAYTRDLNPKVQRATAVLLSGFIFLVMAVSMVVGDKILTFFGISVPAFQIAGGIIVFLIALSMMSGKHSEHTQKSVKSDTTISSYEQAESILPSLIVPLGIPIYCGPGAISTAVLIATRAPDEFMFISAFIVLAGVIAIILLCNGFADSIAHALGPQGVEIVVRLMGLILAAIGIQLIFEGLLGGTVNFINPVIASSG
jgi:multiple antibiotic resistance protein